MKREMRNLENQSATWPFQWFGAYGLAYCLPLLVMAVLLLEHETWFIGLSSCLTLLIGYHAWCSSKGQVAPLWRVAFAIMMAGIWGYTLLLVLAPAGDTKICYDRLRKTHPWARIENLGPDPYCKGVPIEAAIER